MQANNTSGITGVMFMTRDYGAGPVPYVVVAYVDEHGVDHRYARSAERHTPEGALKFALKMRRRMGAKNVPKLEEALRLFGNWYYSVRRYG